MDDTDNDERLDYGGLADPFMDIDCFPEEQTGSDWYALALSASLGGKALHGFTFATTSETIGKTTYDYAAKHTVGWIKTNEAVLKVDQPGDDWDEVVRPTRLHTGVVTGSQLAMMFDTDSWEPSTAARARNTAFLAAGMVSNGMSMSDATNIASKVSGEDVSEAAVINTVVPVSHLKREAAGVSKSSHSIFSRMNAQRYIAWQDTQLHQGILPHNASLDWAKVTVVARYLAEANMRYDPNFRMLARVTGVPYILVKGAWAYVGKEDYVLKSEKWPDIQYPDSYLVRRGALKSAYATHTDRLSTQIMRTYNTLASEDGDQTIDALLRMAENLRTRRSSKTVRTSVGTDVLASTSTHQQSAATAAHTTATSATSYNALVQSFGEFALSDRNLKQRASYIVAVNRRYDDIVANLQPFFPILSSKHTWFRAYDILNTLVGNPRTALDRMNRLHRSVTQSSQTIESDVPLTSKARHAMGPHILALIKKSLLRPGPTVALPRYISDYKASVARGEHAQLLRSIGDHLTEYRCAWADRYEDWARVFAVGNKDMKKSILYGAASLAFRELKASNVMSHGSQYIDGSNIKTSYLYKMATDYARKRRLARPVLPIKPISGAKEYSLMLDAQYKADVSFADVEAFVTPKISMFSEDLALGLEPQVPVDDEPEEDVQEVETSGPSQEEFDLAELMELMGEEEEIVFVTEERVAASYPPEVDIDAVARENGYANFSEAYEDLKEGARWDNETPYTRKWLARNADKSDEDVSDGVMIS
jgi:hypothetical protein